MLSLHSNIHGAKTAQSLNATIMAMDDASPPVRCGVGPAAAGVFHFTLARNSHGNPTWLAAGLRYSRTLVIGLVKFHVGHLYQICPQRCFMELSHNSCMFALSTECCEWSPPKACSPRCKWRYLTMVDAWVPGHLHCYGFYMK